MPKWLSCRLKYAILPSAGRGGQYHKAVTKGYAIGSAGLAAIVLFASYTMEISHYRESAGILEKLNFTVENPWVLAGLIIGGALPFIFSALAMGAVGRAANEVVSRVRRQFQGDQGADGRQSPAQYGRCVDIVTRALLKK